MPKCDHNDRLETLRPCDTLACCKVGQESLSPVSVEG